MLQAGAKVLVDEKDLWDKGEFITTVLIVNKKFAAEHPATVKALLKGHVESVDWLNAAPAAEKASVLNAALKESAGAALPADVIDRSLKNIVFTVDPLAGTYKKLLQDGVDAGTTKQADINGIFDLTALNASWRCHRRHEDLRAGAGQGLAVPGLQQPANKSKDVTMPVVLEHLGKRFGDGAPVLDDVNATIGQGEFVALLGASGCGKSTLLNIMAGLEAPTSGALEVPSDGAAFMFQDAALFPWLTARENIELALKLRGVGKAGRRLKADELLDLVHLGGAGDKRPHELSGGMRQRVALARSLAQDRQLLLMDEPFAALDAITRDLLHDELERIWKETGRTIVFVTHNVREAVRLGQRVLLLSSRPGRVVQEWHVSEEHRTDAGLAGQLTGDHHRPATRGDPPPCQISKLPGRSPAETRPRHRGALTRSSTGSADLRELESGLDSLQSDAARKARIDWSRILLPVAALAVLLVAWQLYVSLGFKRRDLVPGPLDVLGQLGTLWGEGKTQEAIWTSLQRGVVGFLISVAIATPGRAAAGPGRTAAAGLRAADLRAAGAALRGVGAGRHHLVRPDRRHRVLRGVHGRHPVHHQRPDFRRGPDPAAVPQRRKGPGRVAAAARAADHPPGGPARLPGRPQAGLGLLLAFAHGRGNHRGRRDRSASASARSWTRAVSSPR